MSKKRTYLELTLKDEIVEGSAEHPVFSRKSRIALHDVLEILNCAAKDSRVAALAITMGNLDAGWARLSDIRRALLAFRRTGKPIYCYMYEGGNAEYYTASACDRVFMPPAALLNLIGLAAEVFFFRDLLDRFGIDARLQSVGEYKSAAEMFTRTGMSPPAREQLDTLIDDHYQELCGALESRGFTREETVSLIDSGPYTGREAMKQKLIDGVCYRDEVIDKLKEQTGEKIRPLPGHKYSTGDGFLKRLCTFGRARIAFIDVQGHIASGESRPNQLGRSIAGSETLESFLDHACRSRRVRAIVVRVDSPGGTGLASDLIWRKISLVRDRKPVVVSFGDVAASGGYYIASAASYILAEPTSITGSIGVLAGKFIARELMNRLSIHREAVLRGEHAAYASIFSEFSEEESEKLNRQMVEFYREDFLKKVSGGRKISEEAVNEVGRGRVWSGRRAKEHKLVDSMGGMLEAVQQARRLAGIPDSRKTRVVHYHRRRRLWERFMPEFRAPAAAALLSRSALAAADLMENFGKHTLLLVLPYEIRIR